MISKPYYVEVFKSELVFTSTYVSAKLNKEKLLLQHIDTLIKLVSKLINGICVYFFICCQSFTKVHKSQCHIQFK